MSHTFTLLKSYSAAETNVPHLGLVKTIFSNREHWGKGSGFPPLPLLTLLSILLAAGQHQHPGALGGNAQLQRIDW